MNKGDTVAWLWANGLAQGVLAEVCPQRTEIVSKGKKIVRIGSHENPALIITHASGNPVLKLQSEVQKTS
jgi:hypothetical protein